MSASLVGSEMCIRDSDPTLGSRCAILAALRGCGRLRRAVAPAMGGIGSVSYTHLTLPTICSV
eukprot:8893059-Alexandrium_andersonii.AAC.1